MLQLEYNGSVISEARHCAATTGDHINLAVPAGFQHNGTGILKMSAYISSQQGTGTKPTIDTWSIMGNASSLTGTLEDN